MKRCSDFSYSLCPDRHICGRREDAIYMEGSECDAFNKANDLVVMQIGGASARAADHAVSALWDHIDKMLHRVENGLEGINAEN